MLIEPRRAAPGALPRWSRQALALFGRAPVFWLGLSLLLCLCMFVSQRVPLIGGMLALITFFSSILLAEALDRRITPGTGELLEALRAHRGVVLAFAAVVTAAGALIWILLLSKPGTPWWSVLYNERNIVVALSADGYIALRQVFVYAAYALGLLFFGLNLPGLTSFLQFPCTTLLHLPFRDAYRLGAAAQMLNLLPMLGVGLLFVVVPVVTVLLLPPLVPALYAFFGALAYVAFREIFLGITENQVREPAVVGALEPGRVA
jgi:hypothetical protein